MIAMYILLLTVANTAGYNDDANNDWIGLSEPVSKSSPTHGNHVAALDDHAPFHLSGLEFGSWIIYTILTLLGIVVFLYRIRILFTYLFNFGTRGIRGVDIEMNIHTETGTTTIHFGRHQRDQVSEIAVIENLSNVLRDADSAPQAEPIPTSFEQFHDCLEE